MAFLKDKKQQFFLQNKIYEQANYPDFSDEERYKQKIECSDGNIEVDSDFYIYSKEPKNILE